MSTNLPVEGESQEIGKLAGRAFVSRLPPNWIEKELDGDTDFGLDYLIQLKTDQKKVIANFYLQLKGTRTPLYVSDGKELSYQFSSKSLNYYRKSEPEIMVAITDLSVASLARDCPTYYKWLDEDFLDSISDKTETNDKVSIRVSTDNLIHEDLEILDYYLQRLERRDRLLKLRRSVEKHSTNPNASIDALSRTINDKPVILELAKDNSGAPWVSNPMEHNCGKLKTLNDAVSNNQINRARDLIVEIEDIQNLTTHELAEFYYLKGRLYSILGDEVTAFSMFESAFESNRETRYKAGYFESFFRQVDIPEAEELQCIISDLDESIIREAILKAKCLAILKDEEGALSVLSQYPQEEVFNSKLLVYTIVGNYKKFNELAESINREELKGRSWYLYNIFLSRRLFYEGIHYDFQEFGNRIIPPYGEPHYDYVKLQQSYDIVNELLSYSKENGYPVETYQVVEVAVSLFSIFNHEKFLIKYLEEILESRPDNNELINAIVPLKLNKREFEDVIHLLEPRSSLSLEQSTCLISAYYHSGKKRNVISQVDKIIENLVGCKPQHYEAVLCIAAQCAYEILDEEKEKQYLSVVSDLDHGNELIAVYEYIKSNSNEPENSCQHKKAMYDNYLSLDKSYLVAQQLFLALNPNDTEEVEWICRLAETILSERELSIEESILYGFSLLNKERWEDLERLCQKVKSLNITGHVWALFQASIFEAKGKSSEALKVLDSSLEQDSRSVERATNYVNLCVKFGYLDKAEEKLLELLENSAVKKQLSILEMLLFIYSSDLKYDEKIIPTLTRYGQLVDQNNEEEEGAYLVKFLLLGTRKDLSFSREYVESFQKRLAVFSQNYPESKVLWSGNIPAGGSGEQILSAIRKATGITETQVEEWKRNKYLIRSRKMPVPYALLNGYLSDVKDILTAWVLGKYLKPEQKEYCLEHFSPNVDRLGVNYTSEIQNVVFDETTILVLNDLGLLEICLAYFNRIEISKYTFELFSKLSHPMFGSIYSNIAKDILDTLGRRLDKIRTVGKANDDQHLIKRYENILTDSYSRYFCSDDRYLCTFLHITNKDIFFINSVVLIDILYANKQIDASLKAKSLENLCTLGITSVYLTWAHVNFLIFHHKECDESTSILSTDFKHVFDTAFPVGLSLDGALDRISNIFSKVLNESHSEADIVYLSELLPVWMVRYPELNKEDLLAHWFVYSCWKTDYILENTYVKRGRGQGKLMQILKNILSTGEEIGLDKIFVSISRVILSVDSELASKIYEKVIASFIEDDSEHKFFAQVYSQLAIEHRIKEANLSR